MRPLEEAQAEVLGAMSLLPIEAVALADCLGLALAEDVVAPHPVPPFDNSAVDGYAVRAEDLTSPGDLLVLEDVPAGHVARRTVVSGTAIKIMTGAPIPAGADAVVKVEDTSSHGEHVTIEVPVPVGTALRPAGGDMRAGAVVFSAGTVLGPAHLGVLASIGLARPTVRRRPLVTVLSTGDELESPTTQVLSPGKIRDSNRPLLLGLLAELGAHVDDRGIVPDDATLLRSTLFEAAARSDAIVTSGGVSMGDYDLVKQVLGELGTVSLWKVAMQPAKPFAFGHIAGTPLFGLPGNPVSAFVAFEQFVRPALLTKMGIRRIFRVRIPAQLAEPVDTDPDKTVFLRMKLRREGELWMASLAGGQSSNVLTAMADADCFGVVERGRGRVEAGQSIPVEMFRWPAGEEER
jgi:molybdopterin molybdotransferase